MVGREYVTAYVVVSGEGGPGLENHALHLLRARDGKLAEMWFYNRDQDAVDAYWSAAGAL